MPIFNQTTITQTQQQAMEYIANVIYIPLCFVALEDAKL